MQNIRDSYTDTNCKYREKNSRPIFTVFGLARFFYDCGIETLTFPCESWQNMGTTVKIADSSIKKP